MRSRAKIFTFCLAACVLVTMAWAMPSARANIVNVQTILTTEADEGLSGSITGALDWRTGNSPRLWMTLSPVARYRRGDHLFVAMVSGEFDRTQGIDFAERIFEHLRYRRTINCWLTGEVFGQHEYNEKRRLLLRALAGAGPKFQLVDTRRLHVGLGVAYMLEYEQLNDASMIDPGETSLGHRISSYLTGTYAIDERLLLVGTIYGQPRLTDAADVRSLLESQLVVKVSTHLSFTTSFSLFYDSEPPDTVEALDTRLQSSITYQF